MRRRPIDVIKRPKRKGDWEGLRVRTLVSLQNEKQLIPAGTTFEVERNYRGLTLVNEKCPLCGVRVRITKVPEGAVEITGVMERKKSR